MKSIIQSEKSCFLCGRRIGLERHHIFAGVANRKISEENGLWVWLCHDCHTGASNCAQYDKDTNIYLKQTAQMAYEKTHTHNQWMQLIRKNYV